MQLAIYEELMYVEPEPPFGLDPMATMFTLMEFLEPLQLMPALEPGADEEVLVPVMPLAVWLTQHTGCGAEPAHFTIEGVGECFGIRFSDTDCAGVFPVHIPDGGQRALVVRSTGDRRGLWMLHMQSDGQNVSLDGRPYVADPAELAAERRNGGFTMGLVNDALRGYEAR